MPDEFSVPDLPSRDTADRAAVEHQLRRAGLPAGDDEIEDLCATYQVIRGPIAALYSERVEELLG